MRNKVLIYFVIITQLVIIGMLGFSIYQKKVQVLGSISISPIENKSIIHSSDLLQYFYEPKPNTINPTNRDLPIPNVENLMNSDGLNEERDYEIARSPDTIRILTLGDSFTYGLYVETKDNWTEVLERKLNDQPLCSSKKYEVINFGVGGYDIQYSLERYRLRGQKYDPDVIIWFFIQNDFELPNELILNRQREIKRELIESGEFKKYVSEGDYYPSWRIAQKEIQEKYSKQTILQQQKEFLDEFLNLYNKKLLFIALPFMNTEYKDLMKEMLLNRHDSFYHELPNIKKNSALTIPNDGHPTVEGHTAIAEDLYDYLSRVLRCK